MGKRHRMTSTGNGRTVRFAGRHWPVLERRTVGRRTYLILEKTGGDLRALLELPRSSAALQHVRVLKRLSAGNVNLPTILEYRSDTDRIVLVLTWVQGPDLAGYLEEGLSYGPDYGEGYYSSANTAVLYHTIKTFPDIVTYRELADRVGLIVANAKKKDLHPEIRKAGVHVQTVLDRLGSFEALRFRRTILKEAANPLKTSVSCVAASI